MYNGTQYVMDNVIDGTKTERVHTVSGLKCIFILE